jgi:hypothetical protein
MNISRCTNPRTLPWVVPAIAAESEATTESLVAALVAVPNWAAIRLGRRPVAAMAAAAFNSERLVTLELARRESGFTGRSDLRIRRFVRA